MKFLALCVSIISIFHGALFAHYKHDKWIIVTTIQYPTAALRKLAQLEDWQLLVVGDKKTPTDWYLDDRCIYLSPEDQNNLPYAICKLLPWNHYARKNIGYLYAIEHGAKTIYETDDDNYVVDGIKVFQNQHDIVTLTSQNPVINVYSYFGQPTIWPRGYPLQHIAQSDNFKVSEASSHKRIVIEQGLVNKAPDVDAIFRLTRNDSSSIYFDENKPACIIADAIFCPFNTQNTLFHQEAFWGLYIPTHVPFRVCDIWRGYIMTRLLWESEYALCFTPPSAIQERNEHDLMQDFKGELELYLSSQRLIDCLMIWKADNSTSYLRKMEHLYDHLITHKFMEQKEKLLIQAWNNDLKNILGYE